jgi:hypothetical protein
MEIKASRLAYGVDWGEEAIRAAREKYPLPMIGLVKVKPGAYGLSNKEPYIVVGSTVL